MSDSDDTDPPFKTSPLSGVVAINGVQVQIDIYDDLDGKWILAVIDADNAFHVWDHHFDTDQQASDEALRALREEPLELWVGGDSPDQAH